MAGRGPQAQGKAQESFATQREAQGVKMNAKKAGVCKVCGKSIAVGDSIKWYRGWGAKHVECKGDLAEEGAGGNGNGRKPKGRAQPAPSELPTDERQALVALLEEAGFVVGAFSALCAEEDKATNTCRRAEDLQKALSQSIKSLSSFAKEEVIPSGGEVSRLMRDLAADEDSRQEDALSRPDTQEDARERYEEARY